MELKKTQDLNCHKAVHINMKLYNQEYDEIKAKLASNFLNN